MIIDSGVTGAFNIGRDDDERSMLYIAQKSCDIAGADYSLIQEVDPPAKKTMIKRLSTQKLRSLGWRPAINLDEGMIKLYEWIKQFSWEDQNDSIINTHRGPAKTNTTLRSLDEGANIYGERNMDDC